MLYRQGMILPNHPGNTGTKPMLIGSREQVAAQMQYIYRGNYGLISPEEMMQAGIDEGDARDLMRLKLKFAFGSIRPTADLLDSRIVTGDPVEIQNGVVVRRVELNVFEVCYRDEKVAVDLNLASGESYGVPYPLNYHEIGREYFAVIHSGEGDGWDINRPTMSSILMFQGRIYLLDAGPNLHYGLNALGIGINEVEGIFHTHCHDDHFCGLTTLMRGDRKIKYYATPLVRASVARKLAALLAIDEEDFASYFECHDLECDAWNAIEGLEVRPIFSPHPVETSIFLFRALGGGGHRSYAHFADIVSKDVLEGMITESDSEPGVSAALAERVLQDYLEQADLKKIDIGGGMIHGNAEDFRHDPTSRIILAHTSAELTDHQKEIGSGAPFGTVDMLMPSEHDPLERAASVFLQSYFPSVPHHQIAVLLNNPVASFNPESILLGKGEESPDILLILAGSVEQIDAEMGVSNLVSAGALLGEVCALEGRSLAETYRASSFVKALRIPRYLYGTFVDSNGLYERVAHLANNRDLLQKTWLFGESVSYPTQNRLAEAMEQFLYGSGSDTDADTHPSQLNLVCSGSVERYIGKDSLEVMGVGDFYGEETAVFGIPALSHYRTLQTTELCRIPGEVISEIPIVRWKLFETYHKRLESVLGSGEGESAFQWRDEYSVGVQGMDLHHRRLLSMASRLQQRLSAGESTGAMEGVLDFLIRYSEFHFSAEEDLMGQYGYPGLDGQLAKHRDLAQSVLAFREKLDAGD
ncbi:MAG: hemerythrin domain-containing protein, partial [Candidatus Latescibacteria bacterium]|nr:hemerythrin domain-containing protein [Candidatus Latescibacterota bacterium]